MTECVVCGITPGDLPYEEMGLTLEEAEETMFVKAGDLAWCMGHIGRADD